MSDVRHIYRRCHASKSLNHKCQWRVLHIGWLVRFSIWPHTFKMVAMTFHARKCCHLVSTWNICQCLCCSVHQFQIYGTFILVDVQVDIPAYMIAHSTVFYLLSLGAALLLLALAFLEPPSVSTSTIPIMVRITCILFHVVTVQDYCCSNALEL